jgi:hypothetical protein
MEFFTKYFSSQLTAWRLVVGRAVNILINSVKSGTMVGKKQKVGGGKEIYFSSWTLRNSILKTQQTNNSGF